MADERIRGRRPADLTVPTGANGQVGVPKLGTTAEVTLDGEPVWTIAGPVGDATSDDHYLYFPNVGPGPHTLAALFDPQFVAPDFDFDHDVDMEDFGHLQACLTGLEIPPGPACANANLDGDEDVDQDEVGIFTGCLPAANVPANPNCAD